MSKKTISVESLVAAANKDPQGFIKVDLEHPRGTKNSANLYHTVNFVEDGKSKRLRFQWEGIPLTGGIKPPEERKYDPTISFRQSSGGLGDVVYRIYEEYERQVSYAKDNGHIKPKKGKDNICTIVQKELEDGTLLDDPLIRFKLSFDPKTGNPMFKVFELEKDEDDNVIGKKQVKVTKENVHEIVRARSVTTGYVSMDTVVFSGFGISMPAKVEVLIIEPPEDDTPDVDDLLGDRMMKLSTKTETSEKKTDETKTQGASDANDDEAQGNDTEKQLDELARLAAES